MKKIVYLMACFCVMCLHSCSFADLSSPHGDLIPDIIIDVSGVPHTIVGESDVYFLLTTRLGERLVVEPKVSAASNPERDFSYEWRLGNVVPSNFSTMVTDYSIPSREEKLDIVVTHLPSDTPYQLWFLVTDNKTGLVTYFLWRMRVDLVPTQGLLVAHSNDGVTSELSLLQDTLFSAAFRGTADKAPDPTKISHSYSTVNNTTYNGIIKDMFWRPTYLPGGILTNILEGHSGNNIFQINLANFTIIKEGQEMFLEAYPVTLDIRTMFPRLSSALTTYTAVSTTPAIWSDRTFRYSTVASSASISLSQSGYSVPTLGSPPDALAYNKVIEYDPDPVISRGSSNFMFYDKLNGRFLYFAHSYTVHNTRPSVTTHSDALPFDSRNVGVLDILAGGAGNNSDHRFVVRQQNGEYNILSMNQSDGSARAIININDAPNITRATHFFICVNQPVVYYATSDREVYSIYFVDGLGYTVTYNKVWTSSDPINGLYFTKQNAAAYPITYNGTALVVTTTANQSEGTVWVLPFLAFPNEDGNPVITGTGEIDNSKIVSFSGFGRISTIAMVH